MDAYMNECMDTYACMNAFMNAYTNASMNVCINAWMNTYVLLFCQQIQTFMREDTKGLEPSFYILHRNGVPFSNVTLCERGGVAILGNGILLHLNLILTPVS